MSTIGWEEVSGGSQGRWREQAGRSTLISLAGLDMRTSVLTWAALSKGLLAVLGPFVKAFCSGPGSERWASAAIAADKGALVVGLPGTPPRAEGEGHQNSPGGRDNADRDGGRSFPGPAAGPRP